MGLRVCECGFVWLCVSECVYKCVSFYFLCVCKYVNLCVCVSVFVFVYVFWFV